MKKIIEDLKAVGVVKVNNIYSVLVDLFGDLETYAFNLKSNRYIPNCVHAFENTYSSLVEELGCYQLDTIYDDEERSPLTELSVLISFVSRAIKYHIKKEDYKDSKDKFFLDAMDTINNSLLPTIYRASIYILKFFKDNLDEINEFSPIDTEIKDEFLDFYDALLEMVDEEDLYKTPSDILGFNISEMFEVDDEQDSDEQLPTAFGEV